MDSVNVPHDVVQVSTKVADPVMYRRRYDAEVDAGGLVVLDERKVRPRHRCALLREQVLLGYRAEDLARRDLVAHERRAKIPRLDVLFEFKLPSTLRPSGPNSHLL